MRLVPSGSWRLSIYSSSLVGQGCTRYQKQTPCAPSLRVLRVSVCIRLAHAEARRWGAQRSGRLARHGRPDQGSMYLRTAIIRYTLLLSGSWRLSINPLSRTSCRAKALGCGMQSPPARAKADYSFKDHKPSAMQGEARLRGLWRIITSKTILLVHRWRVQLHNPIGTGDHC
jgi:hypothetical protein